MRAVVALNEWASPLQRLLQCVNKTVCMLLILLLLSLTIMTIVILLLKIILVLIT